MTRELIRIASGYQGVEGPCIDGTGGLYFSDSVGGGVYHLDADGEVSTVVPRRRGVGGIVCHAEGGIVISGRDICHVKNGESRILLTREDVPSPPGTRVGGFNDLTSDRDGHVLVGSTRFNERDEPLPGELLFVTGPHQALPVYGDVGMTNGIAQSADGARLFHADTERRRIIHSSIGDDGVPVPDGEFTADIPGRPDGLATDVDGGLWVAWGCYVLRFDADGKVERAVEVPAEQTLNCCFGGQTMTDLFIVTMDNILDPHLGACIYRTTLDVAGAPVSAARV